MLGSEVGADSLGVLSEVPINAAEHSAAMPEVAAGQVCSLWAVWVGSCSFLHPCTHFCKVWPHVCDVPAADGRDLDTALHCAA